MEKKYGNRLLISGLLAVIFFVIGVLTISDYGVSWDETVHFRRGQAYWYYFLTGKTEYQNFRKIIFQGTKGDPEVIAGPRWSYYQNLERNGEFFLENDGGHPPLNGILASVSNYIFYQKLGLMGDIAAYQFFNVLASTLLVFVVSFLAMENFGILAGMVAYLSLVTYPLFFAESHFNIKDPASTAFFAGAVTSFYYALKNKSERMLILFWIFLGLALGVKLNILFVLVILIVWLAVTRKYLGFVFSKRFVVTSLLGLLIVSVIFMGAWPFLWREFPQNLLEVFGYYKSIGTGFRYQPESYYLLGFNTYAIRWIILTTPPVVLFLSIVGMGQAIRERERGDVSLLVLVWFWVPIVRVTLPGTTIYGGVRQIMEFLPAMAILSGVGAGAIIEIVKKRTKGKILLGLRAGMLLVFLWPVAVLTKLHPYENVYFNVLAGGLAGAKEKNIPSWGNTYGSVYKTGVEWINENVEEGARLSLVRGNRDDAPLEYLRSDVDLNNTHWSGNERGGEYLIGLNFDDTRGDFNYVKEYTEKILIPVYELKTDGVVILTVWKNDWEHTRGEFKKDGSCEIFDDEFEMAEEVQIDLGEIGLLSKIEMGFEEANKFEGNIYIETSLDGENWSKELDNVPSRQVGYVSNLFSDRAEFYLAGRKAGMIRLNFEKANGLDGKLRVRVFGYCEDGAL